MNKLNTLAQQLAEIVSEKKSLEIKEGAIKEALLAEMHKENKDKETFEFGTVSVTTRRTYIYSEAIKKLENKIKIKKDEEVKTGLAEEKVTEFISFRESK
jgi:hypothetical protein